MTTVRGTWNIHEMIATQWLAECDELFRSYAGTADTPHYVTLHDTEARPNPPGPYAIYMVGVAGVDGRSGGLTAVTFQQYETVPVEFRIHSQSKDTTVALAKIVAAAFDPSNCLALSDGDDMIRSQRISDGALREDDTEYQWMLSYEFLVDATYDLP